MGEKIKLSGVPETMLQTMAVREKRLPESGAISQVAMSAMDNWGDGVKERDVPVLVLIAGLTMYLSEAEPLREGHGICGGRESDGREPL